MDEIQAEPSCLRPAGHPGGACGVPRLERRRTRARSSQRAQPCDYIGDGDIGTGSIKVVPSPGFGTSAFVGVIGTGRIKVVPFPGFGTSQGRDDRRVVR